MDTDLQTEIIHVVHSLAGGGTERSVVTLLSRLHMPLVSQRVITLRNAGRLVASLPDHISCRALGKTGRSRSAFISLARLTHCSHTLIHARNTCCWTDATLAAILKPDVTLVLGFHGLEIQGLLPMRHRWIARLAHYIGGRFISVSESGRAMLHHQAGIPHERIEVIHTGIDRKKFTHPHVELRHKARIRLGITADTIAIGCVGSLTAIKNHEQLLRAFAACRHSGREAVLVLIGEGQHRTKLHRLADQLGVEKHVRLLGQCPEVAPLLTALDIYVCCSHSEGISNAMLEAMACGLPIITNDVGDHRLVVRHAVDGMVLDEATVDSLVVALIKLADSHALRGVMGASACERVKRFDVSRMVAEYEAYYHKCLFPSGATVVTKSSHAPILSGGPFVHPNATRDVHHAVTSGNDRES